MKSVKILHCADLHFDTPFAELSHIQAEKRKEDLKETFSKMIALAKEENVRLFLISGDLFDNDRVRKSTLEYLVKKFQEIPDIHVFISPGNHDPYHAKSFYQIVQWPENVHIFKGGIEKICPEEGLCVYGAAFSQAYQRSSLFKNFCVEDPNQVNLMVLHGDVVSAGQQSAYNPIAAEAIRKSGLDYLALGHRHKHSGIEKEGDTFWSYSGNPEGRGFDETGPRGILIGEVGKGGCDLEFREICKRKYFEEEIDISSARTYEEVIRAIRERLSDHQTDENLYKIRLTGEVEAGFCIYPKILEDNLSKDFFFIKIRDFTRVKADYRALAETVSLKGIFAREMLKKIEKEAEEEKKEVLKEALKAGIQALDGREGYIE
ncbi:MAG TPA: DNA repair exonuclease [Clostridiales bacterium]|nr:DNA repair exonuclease [Clostridiales bacterium]